MSFDNTAMYVPELTNLILLRMSNAMLVIIPFSLSPLCKLNDHVSYVSIICCLFILEMRIQSTWF